MLIYPIWVLWQAKIPKEKLSINEKKKHTCIPPFYLELWIKPPSNAYLSVMGPTKPICGIVCITHALMVWKTQRYNTFFYINLSEKILSAGCL